MQSCVILSQVQLVWSKDRLHASWPCFVKVKATKQRGESLTPQIDGQGTDKLANGTMQHTVPKAQSQGSKFALGKQAIALGKQANGASCVRDVHIHIRFILVKPNKNPWLHNRNVVQHHQRSVADI